MLGVGSPLIHESFCSIAAARHVAVEVLLPTGIGPMIMPGLAGPMEMLAMGALNSMYTVGVGVACAAFVTTELCLVSKSSLLLLRTSFVNASRLEAETV